MNNENINLMKEDENPSKKSEKGIITCNTNVLQNPVEHSLYDIFQRLKFGRPAESQLFLQKCIEMLENHPINQIHERGIKHMYRIKKGSTIKIASLPVEILEDVIVESSADIMKTESNFLGSIVLEKLINEEFLQQYPIATISKMKKEKLYFKNEDSDICYPLSYHIANAKKEGLKQIELFEAIQDTSNNGAIWCNLVTTDWDKSECNKSGCADYLAPQKGRICQHRGKLMDWGNNVKFDVETSEDITRNGLKVKFSPKDIDSTFIGLIISENKSSYLVMPYDDLSKTARWNKKNCIIME